MCQITGATSLQGEWSQVCIRAKESSNTQCYLTHPGITETPLSPKLIPCMEINLYSTVSAHLMGKTIKYIGRYRLYLSAFGGIRGLDFYTSATLDNLPLVQPVQRRADFFAGHLEQDG